MNYNSLIGLVLVGTLLAGCANFQDKKELKKDIDPLEDFNRMMFSFNYNVLDPYLVRPVAVAWREYIPILARTKVNNFLSNLNEPTSMVNSLLCGDLYRGMIHFNRFFLNTVLGLGGVIDLAGMANDKLVREESHRFGSTLGTWGVGYGFYLVLPGYGSFTPRVDGGNYLDTFYPLLSWISFPLNVGKWIVQGLELRAQLLDSDAILHSSNDPYTFMRNAYFQRHDFLANEGKFKKKSEINLNLQEIEIDLNKIDANE